MHFYNEKTLAERQADFHRRLCAELEDVRLEQNRYQRWAKAVVKAGRSPPPEQPARNQYVYADDSPLTPSQIEIVEGEVEEEENEDDGAVLSPPTLRNQMTE